jgi:hypothetical protein
MWSAIISAIAAGFRLVASYFAWAKEKALVALGKQQQRAEDLQGRIDALQEANRIRENTITQLDRGGIDGLRSDDGFERKTDD